MKTVLRIGIMGALLAVAPCVGASQVDERARYDVDLQVSASVAAAANNQTLAAVAGKRTYIAGFSVAGGGATAASVIAVTVTGVANTMTYHLAIPAGATGGITPLVVTFPRPIPASADNTAIVVNVPSFGVGNTAASATALGFQR